MDLKQLFKSLTSTFVIILIYVSSIIGAEGVDGPQGHPGAFDNLRGTIDNIVSQLKVYQMYIDQAFKPLEQRSGPGFLPKPPSSFVSPTKPKDNLTSSSTSPQLDLIETRSKSDGPVGPLKTEPLKNEGEETIESVIDLLIANEGQGPQEEPISDPSTHGNEIESESPKSDKALSDLVFQDSVPELQKFAQIQLDHDQSEKYDIDARVDLKGQVTPEASSVKGPRNPQVDPSVTQCGIFHPPRSSPSTSKTKTRPHIQWPWSASMGESYGKTGLIYKCGGTLISPQFLITSAHCLDQGTNISGIDLLGQKVPVISTQIHPRYQEGKGYNDLALIQLGRVLEVRSSGGPFPACLHQRSDNQFPPALWITEWKYKYLEGGSLTLAIENSFATVVDLEQCTKLFETHKPEEFKEQFPSGLEPEAHVCVKDRRGNSCQGNAGNALFVRESGTGLTNLVGTVVKGEDSCDEKVKLPGIYTRMSKFSRWIQFTQLSLESDS